jgi:hypothetical protein
MLSRAIDCSGGQQISEKSIWAAYPAFPGSTERRTRDLETVAGRLDRLDSVCKVSQPNSPG